MTASKLINFENFIGRFRLSCALLEPSEFGPCSGHPYNEKLTFLQ